MGEPLLGLAPGTVRVWQGLQGPRGTTTLTDLPLIGALERGAPLEELLRVGTPRAGRDVRGVLDVLHRRQLLAWRLGEGREQACVYPLIPDVPLLEPVMGDAPLELSRFALLRLDRGGWLLESGRSPFAAHLGGGAIEAIGSGRPHPLAGLLAPAGLLAGADDPAARHWEFHDRYFAARSRLDIQPAGGTFRFAAEEHAPPFTAAAPSDRRIPLPAPEVDAGPGLWDVTERRRSIRHFAPDPVTLSQLGSLLWHTLRVVTTMPWEEADRCSYESVLRPVPSGGALHAVGTWLWCEDVEGVPRGAWWYDPEGHCLLQVPDASPPPMPPGVPVVGNLIARHSRTAWKYERIALALELKDAGVIIHALQLSATALGLGLAPIGSGPGAGTLAALGLDADEHTPVGEFWLGVPRARPDARTSAAGSPAST